MRYYFVLVLWCVLFSFASADENKKDVWLTDYDAGLELSKKEKKPLLVLFTGSDWCPPCIELKEKVFSREDFKQYAKENLICVYLDYAMDGSSSERNTKLANTYRIESFPTMFLVSETEVPISILYAEPSEPEMFIADIKGKKSLIELNEQFTKEKDEAKRNEISQKFLKAMVGGENKFYFKSIYLNALQSATDIGVKAKIDDIASIYYEVKDPTESASIEKIITTLDPENKFGSKDKIVIKNFLAAAIAHDDDAAYKVFSENKTAFKGNDLGYIYHFAMHLVEHGKKKEPVEILNFIKEDPEIKTNEEAIKDLDNSIQQILK